MHRDASRQRVRNFGARNRQECLVKNLSSSRGGGGLDLSDEWS